MDSKSLADVVTAVSTAVIAGTGIAALRYAKGQLAQDRETASEQQREARETERVKHLVEFIREFDSDPMGRWRKTVAQKWLKGEDFPDEAQRLLDFFETVALLVRRGYLDVNDVWAMFSYWMFMLYATFRDDIEQEQKDDTYYYCDFTALLEQLKAIERKNGSKTDYPSRDEIEDFWDDEAKLIPGSPVKKRKKAKKNLAVKPIEGGDMPGEGSIPGL